MTPRYESQAVGAAGFDPGRRASSQRRAAVAARSMRAAATVSVHPPRGIWSMRRYDGRPSPVRHQPRTSASIARGRAAGDPERRHELPPRPPVLGYPRSPRVANADLDRAQLTVRDKVDQRHRAGPARRPVRWQRGLPVRPGQLMSAPGFQVPHVGDRFLGVLPARQPVVRVSAVEAEPGRPVVLAQRAERPRSACGPQPAVMTASATNSLRTAWLDATMSILGRASPVKARGRHLHPDVGERADDHDFLGRRTRRCSPPSWRLPAWSSRWAR